MKFDLNVRKAAEILNVSMNLSAECAARLIGIGITTPDALDGVTVGDLVEAGFDMKDAVKITDSYKLYRQEHDEGQNSNKEEQR
jgi:hypothetical protein